MLFIISVAVGIIVYYILKYLIGEGHKSFKNSNRNKYILWFSIIVGIGVLVGPHWLGTKIPGSIFEKSEYETILYVRLYPENQTTKSYKVPAGIFKTGNHYYVQYLKYPNDNSYIDVCWEAPCIPDGFVEVELNKFKNIIDAQDREWGVELTDEPVR